jgi:hypothetical protein
MPMAVYGGAAIGATFEKYDAHLHQAPLVGYHSPGVSPLILYCSRVTRCLENPSFGIAPSSMAQFGASKRQLVRKYPAEKRD